MSLLRFKEQYREIKHILIRSDEAGEVPEEVPKNKMPFEMGYMVIREGPSLSRVH